MPTVNLGRVKPIFKGAYSGATAYEPLDFVVYSSITYFNIAASTGIAPPNATYWQPLFIQEIDSAAHPSLPQNRTPSEWIAIQAFANGTLPVAQASMDLNFANNTYLIQE